MALVEGGGDFLAAWHFIAAEAAGATYAPVGMLGAGHRIGPVPDSFIDGECICVGIPRHARTRLLFFSAK